MKTKLLFPWNVKVGDTLVITGPHGGEYESKIIQINKERAIFIPASKWNFLLETPINGFKTFNFFGRFRQNEQINPAEKVRIKA